MYSHDSKSCFHSQVMLLKSSCVSDLNMSCKSRSRSRSPILDYKAASCSHINTRSRGTVDDRTRFDKSSNLIQSHSKQDQPSGAEDQERISAFDINDEFDPSPPNFSISSGPSSCENQSQSKQLDKEKIWKLKNADMRILGNYVTFSVI